MACEGQWCLTLRVALEGAHGRNEFRPVPEAKRLGGHLGWRTARPDPMREKRGARGAPGWVSPSPGSCRLASGQRRRQTPSDAPPQLRLRKPLLKRNHGARRFNHWAFHARAW